VEFTDRLIARLKEDGIAAVRHYVPLHSAPAGQRFARSHGQLPVTDRVASTMVRLPLFSGISDQEVERVIDRTIFHARAGSSH